jgi:transcriptional regulator with XRE-family HTH domain
VSTHPGRRSPRSLVGRRALELRRRIGSELRHLRQDAGLTQTALADAAGIDQSYLAQIELGRREPSLTVLEAAAIALGADLGVRLYPTTGPAIHDRTQSAIVEAVLRAAHPSWRRATEVPVYRPVRGVIDVVLHHPERNDFVASEIESRIDRLEQEIRWAAQKCDALPSSDVWRFASDEPPPCVSRLLVLRVTRATRELAVAFGEVLAVAYPARAGDAYDALCGGTPWPGAAVLWADVDAGRARLRDRPPRGVQVGR